MQPIQVNYLVQIRRRKLALDLDSYGERFIMDETLLPRKGTTQPQPQYEMEEVPMKLNDSISTYDVAEALQGETGKF